MEGLETEGAMKGESHLTSAAAFVEGGIQDASDDACSICLEEFCDSDPSTVTCCRHEFHLQCILEWCQRSSQCPMCWQDVRLKDSTSQELLEAIEHEKRIRASPARNMAVFHHPALGEFELQHLPVGASDSELEERIIQHLAAAAAMRRVHHIGRREGHRSRSSSQGRSHFLVYSPHANGPQNGALSSETEPSTIAIGSPSAPLSPESSRQTRHSYSSTRTDQTSDFSSGSFAMPSNTQGFSSNNRNSSPSSIVNQEGAGPSELQSFPDSLKSKLTAASTRYKDSISRSARGWKERFFSRNTSISELGSEVRREVNAGIASVSRMIERLDTREDTIPGQASAPPNRSVVDQNSQDGEENSRVAGSIST